MKRCPSCDAPHFMASVTCSRPCAVYWFNFMEKMVKCTSMPLTTEQQGVLLFFQELFHARGEALLDWS